MLPLSDDSNQDIPNISTFEAMADMLSTHPAIWVKVGAYLYKAMIKRQPLVDHPTDTNLKDLMRYTRMCAAYKTRLEKNDNPVEWRLDKNGCPKYFATLAHSAEEFKAYCESMREGDFPMKVIVVKMVASIERLYESINKRSYTLNEYKRYRADGYEAMFFSELAQWLCVDLPRYSVTEENTARLVQKRILYCEEALARVFVYRDDVGINNPIDRLRCIIKDLKILHADILKSIKAAAFNQSIEAINRDLKDIIVNAFDVLHLCLEHVNQRELQVDQFLEPEDVDVKVKKLLQTTMGQWIKLTLQKAGIKSNNFESGDGITHELIDNYLEIDFSKIDLNATGLPAFAKADKAYAVAILKQVINIHRLILHVCYVRSTLVKAARVGIDEGEKWTYGNDEGKPVVKSLLIVIDDARQQH